jgi:hypothetical protein
VENGRVRSDQGEALTDVRVPVAGIDGRSAGVNAGELPVVPYEDRVDDGVRHDEGNPMASASCSNACWNGAEGRLEMLLVAVIFG